MLRAVGELISRTVAPPPFGSRRVPPAAAMPACAECRSETHGKKCVHALPGRAAGTTRGTGERGGGGDDDDDGDGEVEEVEAAAAARARSGRGRAPCTPADRTGAAAAGAATRANRGRCARAGGAHERAVGAVAVAAWTCHGAVS